MHHMLKISTFLVAGFCTATPVLSQAVDFSNKRVEMVITSGEGGGADTYARFMGEVISRELPGQPTFIYRNMAGGGGIMANNWFEANGTPDGLIIMSMTSSSIMRPVFGKSEDYKFNASQWIPVVTSPNGYVAVGSKVANTMTMESILAQKVPLATGMANVLGTGTMFLLSYEMLGVNVKPAFNVSGGDSQLSFQRGEFALEANSVGSYHRLSMPEVEKGNVAPLFVFGNRLPDGSLVRDETLPNVPTFVEVYEKIHGKKPSGPEWVAWNALFDAVATNAKTIMLSEGTPENIVTAYREAAKRALTKPEMIASAPYKNILGTSPQFFGDDASKAAQDAVRQLNPEVVTWLKKWHQDQYGVPLQ
ncbi:tripartite tricarboxylate transporter substrate-binding protein [Corticibacterium sp. UT-5YL-CI-8]|nr:tripartite tricarboxylate transporter substrate-binding protein [Tianweitania sp. UT-5YL-CI-8]